MNEMNLEILKRPIEPNEIEWRVQSVRNGKTTIVPYIQSRAVMARFDDAFGVDGWQCSFREWKARGVMCTIKVKFGDEWISKEDGADDTQIEPTKGGISDALKRCGVTFGLGRDLYAYPLTQIEGEFKFVPNQVKQRLHEMTRMINEGNFNQEYVILKAR